VTTIPRGPIGWIALAGMLFCLLSVVVLTLLLPSNGGGGFLPLPAPTAVGR
jgi:hypothetical protein